jgi:hypothetical protein
VLKLNIREGVLVDLAAVSANNKSVRASSHRANEIRASNLRLFPFFKIIDLIRIRNLFNVKNVFLPRFLLFLLLKSRQLRVL